MDNYLKYLHCTQSAKVKNNIKYRTYYFSLDIINLVKSFPNEYMYWTFRDQLIRSGTSVDANVAEAKYGASKRDFKHFYRISLKSATETIFWLAAMRDTKLLERSLADKFIQETCEISKMLASAVMPENKKWQYSNKQY